MLNDLREVVRQRDDGFRKVVEYAPEGIFIQSGGRFAYLNPAALRLYGAASAEQLLGQPTAARVHPVWNLLAEERIRLAFERQKKTPVSEEKHLKLDGTVFAVEVSAAPVVYEDSAGAVVFIRDVTGYKEAEEAQRLNRALLRSVIEGATDAIYAKDRTGRFVLVNSAACRMAGKQPREILGRDDAALFGREAAEAITGPHGSRQEELTLASGERIVVRTTEGLVLDEEGDALGVFGIAHDITGRKRSEEEGAKFRGAAHDLNDLLAVINGYGDLLLGLLTPNNAMQECVTGIRQAGERAAALCQQLRAPDRKQIPPPGSVNLNHLIADVEKLLVRVIGENVRLETVLRPSSGQVRADPRLLQQVVMNLAVNARAAMPGGGILLIETEDLELGDRDVELHPDVQPGPYVQLTVSYTGIGMTQDLSLATVYGIVKQIGGAIWAYSEPREGTTFKIYLPRVAGEMTGPKAARSDAATLQGTETILLVEDQDELRKLAGVVLSQYGYRVIEAGNGEEALLHAELYAGPIHLMLSGIVMPGMTGQELADRVKQMRPEMAVAFISNPFSPEGLAATVHEALGTARRAGTILVVDDEPEIRALLRTMLAGAGYQVMEAADGKEALKQLDATEVELVITDLVMPEQDGLETIRVLRKKRPRLKILAISGKFDAVFLRTAELLGAHASLAKPIRLEVLLETVKRLMVS